MRLRRHGSADPESGQPVREFWQWWAAAGHAAAEAGIGGAGFGSFAGEMTNRVKAILHLYADADDLNTADDVRAEAAGWPGAATTSDHDPGWRRIRHLTG